MCHEYGYETCPEKKRSGLLGEHLPCWNGGDCGDDGQEADDLLEQHLGRSLPGRLDGLRELREVPAERASWSCIEVM